MVWAGHHVCWTNQSGIHYIDFNWSYCRMSRSSCLLDNPVTHTLHWLLLGILWYDQVITFVGQSSQAYMCSTLTFTTPLARLIPLLIWKMSFFILIQTTHSHKSFFSTSPCFESVRVFGTQKGLFLHFAPCNSVFKRQFWWFIFPIMSGLAKKFKFSQTFSWLTIHYAWFTELLATTSPCQADKYKQSIILLLVIF